ncbi:hypothetical protein AgCh_002197 [Apium graveolens]
MATSPSPNSSPSADPPIAITAPPPQPLSPGSFQPNATSTTPPPQAPPPVSQAASPALSPPPADSPPPSSNSPPPTRISASPPTPTLSPPTNAPPSTPPPSLSTPPPTPSESPPTSPPLPPASPPPPAASPPLPSTSPPLPPASPPPPAASPPLPSTSPPPPQASPPKPIASPPEPEASSPSPPGSPPVRPASPPTTSASPPKPATSPPLSPTKPASPPSLPESPPTPPSDPPKSQAAPPSLNSPPNFSPPPPQKQLSPPPPSVVPSKPSPPSPVQIPPSGNPSTNNSNTPSASTSKSDDGGGIGIGGTIALVLVLGLLLLSLFGTVIWCVRKRKKKFAGTNGGHIIPTSQSSSPKSGEGGFGRVYKGCLPDGREIAVKQLTIGGGQGEKEFKAEVEIISRVHHRHLVSLVGYCISVNERMLVYDYVPNNNLYFHLHGKGRPVMEWERRVKVAIGAARGIAYLHEDCHPRIIHRDIKSSNILLDNNFESQVSDFGLAKLALDANTHITTRVMGTFGYMAPEYAASGKLTEKSDVYSFGVVLLELITGRKPVDTSQPLGDESLVEWARPLLGHALETEDFTALSDPRLENNYADIEMFRLVEAAAACVRHSAAKRPQMGQVVRAFDSMVTADLSNGMRVGESEIFNSAQQSAEIRLFRRMAFGSQNYSTDYFSQSSDIS